MAANADELRQAISEGYGLKPVFRKPLADSRPDGREPVLGADPGALLTGTAAGASRSTSVGRADPNDPRSGG
jgi:hypothetical protein